MSHPSEWAQSCLPHSEAIRSLLRQQTPEALAEAEARAQKLVSCGCVVKLLGVLQATDEADAELACEMLLLLHAVAERRLLESGWTTSNGQPGNFRRSGSAGDEERNELDIRLPGETWQAYLLQCCRMLATPGDAGGGRPKTVAKKSSSSFPSATPSSSAFTWAVKVAFFHEGPEEDQKAAHLQLHTDPELAQSHHAVLDVLEEDADSDERVVMRKLVLGPWRGIEARAETALDMALPPGSQPDSSWAEATLVGTSALLLASRPRDQRSVLFVGLGGGSVASALVRHVPGLGPLEAVESSSLVAKVLAPRYFGLRCASEAIATDKPGGSQLKPLEVYIGPGSQAPPGGASRKRDRAGRSMAGESASDGATIRVHTADARDFAATALRQGGVPGLGLDARQAWDLIVVDVAAASCASPAWQGTLCGQLALLLAAGGALLLHAPFPATTGPKATAALAKELSSALAGESEEAAHVAVFGEHHLRPEEDDHAKAVDALEAEECESFILLGQKGPCPLTLDTAAWNRHFAPEAGIGGVQLSMDVSQAQLTSVITLPSFFGAEDMAALREVVREFRANPPSLPEVRSFDAARAWQVSFLQTGGLFQQRLPGLLEKLRELWEAVLRVDREHWGLIGEGPCNLRVAEFHTQTAPSPALPDVRHYDQDSLVTIDVLLGEGDFEGGCLRTLEADGSFAEHPASLGDALLFVSHKYHCVTPLTRGVREVLVLEFWRSPERRCGHRCEALGASCVLDPSSWGASSSGKASQPGPGCPGTTPEQEEPAEQLPMRLGASAEDSGGVRRLLWQAAVHGYAPRSPAAEKLDAGASEWDLFD